MKKIYKVTNTKITTSKNGYTIFNLELNYKVWASMLAPIRKSEQMFNRFYKIYKTEQSLDSLIGKFLTILLEYDNYGIKIKKIEYFDSLLCFKELLDKSNNKAFTTDIPVYHFLMSQKYHINSDGSITLKKPYNHFNIIKQDGLTVIYPNQPKIDELTFENIKKKYNYFYKDVPLSPYDKTEDGDGENSYFSMTNIAIVRMDNYSRVSNKMTTSCDYNYWAKKTILKIGDKLPEEYIEYLNKGYISQEKMAKHRTMLQNFEFTSLKNIEKKEK